MARPEKSDERETANLDPSPNPVWFKPVMVAFMLIGLAWVITYYLSSEAWPIPGIGAWNLVIGFGIAFIGFLMTMRWR
ncbi:cell division protein CrgA [Microbacterium gorillae]|uniref:cell division protein CrgA n=1 Tax=Microbacterium gorillae TaxID=1231063 RepID=UPI000590BA8B|nr:cell division protein CrgA [Microbacterium gorillae]